MGLRLDLQSILVDILGTNHVYFQPPPSIQMSYPCIVYKRDDESTDFADNKPYSMRRRYQVTVIDRDPDTVITKKVAELPSCTYDRFYAADNLNHDVYKIFF